jgi:lipoprotein
MKKRWWSVLLAASLISGALAGCGGSAGEGAKTSDPAKQIVQGVSMEGIKG